MYFLPRNVFVLGLLLSAGPGMAQSTESAAMLQSTRDRINFSGLSISQNNILYGFQGPAGKLLGDSYVDTTFQAGNIRFYGRFGGSDSLGGVPVRLDLLANEIEIRVGATDVRVAKGPTVKQFDQNNALGGVSRYVNVREYRGEADELVGFFERLFAGNRSTLLLHPHVVIQKGNFNAALNVGSKDDEYIKKFDWYTVANGRAMKFSPNKKGVLALMDDKKEAIETFLKARKPDLKSRAGLVSVFAYYDSL